MTEFDALVKICATTLIEYKAPEAVLFGLALGMALGREDNTGKMLSKSCDILAGMDGSTGADAEAAIVMLAGKISKSLA